MKHLPAIALLLATIPACATGVDGGDPTPASAWPCGSQRGDVTSAYEYDARHRITHQLDSRDGVPVREVITTFTGELETRVEAHDHDGGQVDVTERDLAGGRIDQVRFSSTSAVGYVEDWTYAPTGELSETRATLANGAVFERDFGYPEPGVEVAFECWAESPNCSVRTRWGGAQWTRELVEGRSRHDRWFDGNRLLIAEEIFVLDGDEAIRTSRREITRRADGAPLTEVLDTAEGRDVTTYLFACAP